MRAPRLVLLAEADAADDDMARTLQTDEWNAKTEVVKTAPRTAVVFQRI